MRNRRRRRKLREEGKNSREEKKRKGDRDSKGGKHVRPTLNKDKG